MPPICEAEPSEPQLATYNRLVERVRAEYLEMPGLQLTIAQAKRLWALDEATCAAVLSALLARRFLVRTASGTHVRAS